MFNFFSGKPKIQYKEDFEILYEQYHNQIYQILFSFTRNHLVAEDAVQEAFYKAFKRFNQLKDRNKFSEWVTSIALNEAKTFLIKANKIKTIPLQNEPDEKADILTQIIAKDEIKRVLDQLKPEERKILDLKYFGDLTIEQLAETLKLTESNVKVKLHRARQSFRVIYETPIHQDKQSGGAL